MTMTKNNIQSQFNTLWNITAKEKVTTKSVKPVNLGELAQLGYMRDKMWHTSKF